MPFINRWFSTIILFIIFALGVFYLMTRDKRKMQNITLFLFGISTIGGFFMYSFCYLMSATNRSTDILIAMLRGIFNTMRMFFVDIDFDVLVSAVGEEYLNDNVWLKILFLVLHISAMIVIQSVLLSLFGRRLIDYFRLRFGPYKEYFFIRGCDKNSLLLGENIATRDKTMKYMDTKRLIIFLIDENGNEKEIYEKVSRFGGIVQVIGGKHNLSYYLERARLGKRRRVYNLILMPVQMSITIDANSALEYAKSQGAKEHEFNLFVVSLSEWVKEKIKTIAQNYRYTIHIINEVELLTRQMILKNPPYNCVNLNLKNGIASKDFTILILGFGTVGQHSLLRLIMNGQFINSKMRAIVIDKNINDIKDRFLNCYPGLKPNPNHDNNLCCNIEFKNINTHNEAFYNFLEQDASFIDYIVVALNDDEENKQLALDIQMHYKRKGLIDKSPFIAVAERAGGLLIEEQNEKVFVFGCREDIFKESLIINEEIDKMAMAVNDVYNENNPKRAKPWSERNWFEQESNRATADFIPVMLYLAGLDKEKAISQGFLVQQGSELAEILAHTEHLRWNAFHVAMGWAPISIEDMHKCFKETNDANLSRKNENAKLHVCLTSWEGLEEVRKEYAKIAQDEDFKSYDREIIEKIPIYLKRVEK